jgi:hypothetical protein
MALPSWRTSVIATVPTSVAATWQAVAESFCKVKTGRSGLLARIEPLSPDAAALTKGAGANIPTASTNANNNRRIVLVPIMICKHYAANKPDLPAKIKDYLCGCA